MEFGINYDKSIVKYSQLQVTQVSSTFFLPALDYTAGYGANIFSCCCCRCCYRRREKDTFLLLLQNKDTRSIGFRVCVADAVTRLGLRVWTVFVDRHEKNINITNKTKNTDWEDVVKKNLQNGYVKGIRK